MEKEKFKSLSAQVVKELLSVAVVNTGIALIFAWPVKEFWNYCFPLFLFSYWKGFAFVSLFQYATVRAKDNSGHRATREAIQNVGRLVIALKEKLAP